MTVSEEVRALERDLREVFGARLQSLVMYRPAAGEQRAPVPTLAVVEHLGAVDLHACATQIPTWHDRGLATPLVIGKHEFERSLDSFPFEFGAIMRGYTVVTGSDPFDGLAVDPADVRRACEIQARSQLLHLRQGYLESGARGDAVAELILRSAPALAALVKSMASLHPRSAEESPLHADAERSVRWIEDAAGLVRGSLHDVVKLANGGPLTPDAARRIFPAYLNALERLTLYIDQWSAT